jgi:Sec-independent protein translocase protein TatA
MFKKLREVAKSVGSIIGEIKVEQDFNDSKTKYPIKKQKEPYDYGDDGEKRSDIVKHNRIELKIFINKKGDTTAVKDNDNVSKDDVQNPLFERLLLSEGKGDKEIVLKLSREGQMVRSASDMIKDPYVFEFLGVPERKPMLEKELE